MEHKCPIDLDEGFCSGCNFEREGLCDFPHGKVELLNYVRLAIRARMRDEAQDRLENLCKEVDYDQKRD